MTGQFAIPPPPMPPPIAPPPARRGLPLWLLLLIITIGGVAIVAVATVVITRIRDAAPKFTTTPLTEQACRDWAAAVAESMTKGDGSLLDNSINSELLANDLMEHLHVPPRSRASFMAIVQESPLSHGPGCQISRRVQSGNGSFRLLRLRQECGQWKALFREAGHEGFNYLDVFLAGGPSHEVLVEDIHFAALGQTMREMMTQMALAVGDEPEAAAALQRLKDAAQAAKEQDPQRALAACESLPPGLRGLKAAMVLRLVAASMLGEPTFSRVAAEYERAFPNDPALEMVSLRSTLLNGQYDAALKTIDKLDGKIGGDPYLEAQRANALILLGRLDEARACVQRGIEKEPDLVDFQWALIAVALVERDFKTVANILTRIETDFGVEIGSLVGTDGYEQFVLSKEYVGWLRGHLARASTRPHTLPK